MFGDPITLAQALLQVPSVTPGDHGCQEILIRRLESLGFRIHRLPFGDIVNFYARLGTTGFHLCLAGHTDVVASGDPSAWSAPPFAGEIREGRLIGRGACDMKGGLAALVTAVERYLAANPDFPQHHSLSFLVTGDEEGDAIHGTAQVLEWLVARGEIPDGCLLGEPTCQQEIGDCIKNGRRGSINGLLTVRGIQGHAAYPELADNPIHRVLPHLAKLAAHRFDAGSPDFAPTSLQITDLASGVGASNVIPGGLTARFNIRFGPIQTPEQLEATIRTILDPMGPDHYTLTMALSGLPFRTEGGQLLTLLRQAIRQVTGREPELSTGGGTSDARFLARRCPQTVEFGLVGSTMHQVNESCGVAQLELLTKIYTDLFQRLFGANQDQG